MIRLLARCYVLLALLLILILRWLLALSVVVTLITGGLSLSLAPLVGVTVVVPLVILTSIPVILVVPPLSTIWFLHCLSLVPNRPCLLLQSCKPWALVLLHIIRLALAVLVSLLGLLPSRAFMVKLWVWALLLKCWRSSLATRVVCRSLVVWFRKKAIRVCMFRSVWTVTLCVVLRWVPVKVLSWFVLLST